MERKSTGDGNVLVLFLTGGSAGRHTIGLLTSPFRVGGLGGGPNRKAVFRILRWMKEDVGILNDAKTVAFRVFFSDHSGR